MGWIIIIGIIAFFILYPILVNILDDHKRKAEKEAEVESCKRAAEQGDAKAQCDLARRYSRGDGVPQDYAKALEWYTKVAEQENAEQKNRVMSVFNPYYRRDAMCEIGYLYRNGQGVSQDYAKALEWFTKAAEKGNWQAMDAIGGLYEKGLGVPQNYNTAVQWYDKAAEKGSAGYQYDLSLRYEKGDGVPRDNDKKLKWLTEAAEGGNVEAQYSLAQHYERDHNYNTAFKWYIEAAEKGNADAMSQISYFYSRGLGVRQDDAKATAWYIATTNARKK